ncbi:MAG: ribonuclease HII [Candidatus Paceibacteria bacterium]|jgi:ribonuclease HII
MNEELIQKKLNTHDVLVGIDEVGRGPIAGPVSVCSFAVRREHYSTVQEALKEITDSKKISEKKREAFVGIIKELKNKNKIAVSVSSVSAKDIDSRGIVPALKAATKQSLESVTSTMEGNTYVYLDGSLFAPTEFDQETIVKGDLNNWLISAASVVAKVARDSLMVKYSEQYPKYFFEKHKGYGTKKHYEAIGEHGLTDIHRKTWIRLK